ncbi:hypothetical protein [Roseobacter sp. HKCCA0434]|nr:hypothetical protein [Roseobacter sp. HKCCA0434]
MRAAVLLIALALSACNVDVVLPADETPDGGVTVVDLNDRTRHEAVVRP